MYITFNLHEQTEISFIITNIFSIYPFIFVLIGLRECRLGIRTPKLRHALWSFGLRNGKYGNRGWVDRESAVIEGH